MMDSFKKISNMSQKKEFFRKKKKKGQAPLIASLQPSTLAPFPTWGSSKGADRKRLARHKCRKRHQSTKKKIAFILSFWTLLL